MKDPARWIDEGADGFESKLLAAGRADAMSAASRRRVMTGLGLAGLIPGSAMAATAKGSSQGGVYLASLGGAAKWLGGGIVGSLALWGGAEALSDAPKPPPVEGAAARSLFVAAERAFEVKPLAFEPQVFEPQVGNLQPSVLEGDAGGKAEPANDSRRGFGTQASLSDEFAHIDRAREALRGGDPSTALALLDEHRRDFPRAALSAEATVLRIEALVAAGDRGAAEHLGEQLLAKHPKGPYAKRVRSLIGKPQAESVHDAKGVELQTGKKSDSRGNDSP